MDKIKPFGKNILIEPYTKQQILSTGSLCEYGTVLAIGSDVKEVKVGDKIGFTIWGLNALEVEDRKYYFVPEDTRFVLGTFE